MVRKTYALCQAIDDKLDTHDYVAGNQDALVRSVEMVRDSIGQMELDMKTIKHDIGMCPTPTFNVIKV